MYSTFLVMFMMGFISNMMMMLANIISKKTKEDREKSSPFECGFDPIFKSRMPFSLRFFLITVIFLIFDVEITLIIPLVYTFNSSSLFIWISIMYMFLTILMMGLLHEWKLGMLNWSK
uniref:NADH-ubiquinone oxidoreductase chain 3 n=1 Tax=Prionoglaris stygia TaxID=1954335 RepID=A0A343QCC8_9NEOP|nr:NADH dehydrogenase subunit 3 [Prionoglaris stygia]ATU07075.1 NADH dehydrogenase subunit 3 [Prionoglaris stygia]